MKLCFDFHERYREVEVHVCVAGRSPEALAVMEKLDGIFNDRIAVHLGSVARSISAYEIVRIYTQEKKVWVRTQGETYEVRDRLYVLEERLRDRGFVRISNTEVVNVSEIGKLDMGYTGTIKMTMRNGDETFVSRRYVSRIKEVLKEER